jgi:B12-binding domain/radical SAM domain protein
VERSPLRGSLLVPLALEYERVTIVAMHARSGIVGLNVVTAALDADPRTENLDVRFVKDVPSMIDAIAGAPRPGQVVALWSFYSPDFDAAARDLAEVKAAGGAGDRDRDRDRALHVAGGVHATAEPQVTLRAGFDLVVLGEGEHTLVEIIDAIASRRDPRALPGTAHLAPSRAFVSHGPGERHPLDRYPPFNARYRKWNPLEITRGCVYACSFCQTPYMFKARFRHRSVEAIRHWIDRMRLSGSRFVRFLTPTSLSYGSDDTTPNLDAVDALLATVRDGAGAEAKVFFGTFPSEIRPEHVTPRALEILRRWVDNRTLVIGGQSGSDRILEETRRGHTVADIVRAVELCVAGGFRPDVDFLLGLPGETAEDRQASMALAERLVEMGARIHSHAFMPLPGTPLRDATPSPIEPEAMLAMARLESKGKAYGQWRRQLVTAESLVRARRAS